MHSEDSTTAGAPLEADRRHKFEGRRLVVRADASASLGLGHAMRCLALAQGWIDAGGTAILVSQDPPQPIVTRWTTEGVTVMSPDEYRASAPPLADWMVVDGPHLTIDADPPGATLILIVDDDGGRGRYTCDLLLNQNPSADPALYTGKTEARLLLGPAYALLRRDFRAWRGWQWPIAPVANSLLITFGGSDPGVHTERALDALALLPPDFDLTVRVLVGGGNPRLLELRDRAARLSGVEVIHDAQDVGALIRQSDMVLSAAGSTLWELAVMAAPMMIGAAVPVEHQPAQAMAARGAAIDLGPLDHVSPETLAACLYDLARNPTRRTALSVAARAVVDGKGVDRVLDAMLDGMARP